MRRILTILFVLLTLAALALIIFDSMNSLAIPLIVASGLILLIIVFTRLTGSFKPIRARPAPSLIAEMERLYFRSMREMLTDAPNLAQVINDLQRVLSIDPTYKNARHYLSRALVLQEDSNHLSNGSVTHSKVEFMRLQEKLIDLDPAVRKSVVMELINYKELAVDPLTALLMDEDADVRVHAATALGWVGGPDAVQPLLVALQDQDLLVRRYAARALCWVVDETATEGLIDALKDEDNYVRSYAARALGWSNSYQAIPALEALLSDESSDVRSYAQTALEDLNAQKIELEKSK